MGSTAAFDKHAKAANLRANTIDLGYSTLTINDTIIALIDCPGHASLIRSVLAASSVFDMAIVVVNSGKGIEQQTAEHLLLVSLLCPDHIIIVINKIDLISEEALEQMIRRCRKVASTLKINSNLQIVPVSLMKHKEVAIIALMNALRLALYTPQRISSGHFVMFVDHCFPVKGKGTIMTGTVVDGICNVGMDVEIAALHEKRKIKSMQRWKEDVRSAEMGDRTAVLFHNVSAKDINRTAIFEPGTLHCVQFLLVSVNRIVHFQGILHQSSKLHISTGFDTVTGQCQFLASPGEKDDYEVVQELNETVKFAIISLERPVYTKEGSFYITSRLDYQGKGCRFVFHGKFLKLLDNDKQICRFRRKKKIGRVERIENERNIICNSLFKKETNVDIYYNMNVYLSTGEVGRLESAFGKNGKVRVSFSEDLAESTKTSCKNGLEIQVTLYFKKFLNILFRMDCILKTSFHFTSIRRITILWNFLPYKSSHSLSSNSSELRYKSVNDMRTKTTNKRRSHVEILDGMAEYAVSNEDAKLSEKGYVEIWRKAKRNEQKCTTKTLSDMREDIDKLAKTLYRLRANEKERREKPPQVVIKQQESEVEEELKLSTYVDGSVERLSFTVRTPDRRVLLKKFTGITVSRAILEMLRNRKVRINEIVTYDFAIVCKPMDTLDIWKEELEENPAFARIDRFQILHILPSSCHQYFTVHAIALRDFVIENWFPWELQNI
ncbi:unnamed protein product [Onchocerca flexuosa]|uniref:Tr-type G domain-containing protein n=1 Tax=Onchocerca flexuosa TaxID=387005 RepID=A0A183I4C7_9BILA|nr:unnamed protein product [Onchocerca flexuosa]